MPKAPAEKDCAVKFIRENSILVPVAGRPDKLADTVPPIVVVN